MKIIIQKQYTDDRDDIKDVEINIEQVEDCIELEFGETRLIIPLEAFFGIFHTTKEIKE